MATADLVPVVLERILASGQFTKAPQLSRFLRFVVEQTLDGRGEELKEYLLGVEVFGRTEGFDPRLDPIVRVEARRLRAKLQEYYEESGRTDEVRIVLRKGGYEPVFEPMSAATAVGSEGTGTLQARAPSLRRMGVTLTVVTLAGVLCILLIWSQATSSSLPLALAAIPSADPESAEFADGLAEATCMELAGKPALQVVAWPAVVEYRTGRGAGRLSPQELARDLGVEAVLIISVRQNAARRRVIAHLMIPRTGQKQWAGEYERGVSEPFAIQRELARAIAEEVRSAVARTHR